MRAKAARALRKHTGCKVGTDPKLIARKAQPTTAICTGVRASYLHAKERWLELQREGRTDVKAERRSGRMAIRKRS